MASVAKAASFIVLARLITVSLRFVLDQFDLFFSAVVILSVLGGALFATNQSDLKRLIAYSGVIQSGFILSGISSGVFGVSASTFYLITYIIQLVGIFTVFSIIFLFSRFLILILVNACPLPGLTKSVSIIRYGCLSTRTLLPLFKRE